MKLYNGGTGKPWMLSAFSLIAALIAGLQLHSAIRHDRGPAIFTLATLLFSIVGTWVQCLRTQRWMARVDEQLETTERVSPKVLNKMSLDNYSLSQLLVTTAMIGATLYHVPKH
jgi:hypothetical protein